MDWEKKLQQLGIELPATPKPIAAYIPAIEIGNIVYTSGQLPIVRGELKYSGKLGKDLNVEQGYEAAKICVLNGLSAVAGVTGSINKIEKIIKVVGFVNSAADFTQQPAVINGASEFLRELMGEKGVHARSAVGVAELPLNAAVEVEIIVSIK